MKEKTVELPREAVIGLIGALQDVRDGNYTVLTSAPKDEGYMVDAILQERINEINNLEDYDEKMKRVRINEAQSMAQLWIESRRKLVSQLIKQEKVTTRRTKNLRDVNRALNKLIMIFWGKPITTNNESFDSIWKAILRIDKQPGLLAKKYNDAYVATGDGGKE
jgi:hypothetical protein